MRHRPAEIGGIPSIPDDWLLIANDIDDKEMPKIRGLVIVMPPANKPDLTHITEAVDKWDIASVVLQVSHLHTSSRLRVE